ncbi:recombinase family protein [Nocardia thraciensis]
MASQQLLRAVVGARVSVVQGPQKVSHIAQHATGVRWTEDNGADVVGTFLDLDVSATVSPFDRPDLGKWFKVDLRGTWDVMVFSKIDRAFRSISDAVEVAKWCKDNGKMLVFAEDGLKLDYRPGTNSASFEGMMAELFIFLGAFFGQLELARFSSRAKDAHSVLRYTDRWASGVAPLGFKTVDHPSGKGKALETDTEGKAILHKMAGKLLEGWSFSAIAIWLNESGICTSAQRERVRKHAELKVEGKKVRGNAEMPWTVFTVKGALTGMNTQGYKVKTDGTPQLMPDGSLVRVGPPTFDDDTWSQIQAAAALRSREPRSKTKTKNKYLGIAYCSCGASMVQTFDTRPSANGAPRSVAYYRCGRTPKRCPNTTVRLDALDTVVEKMFLGVYGNTEVATRVFVPGEDYSHDLELVNTTIARLRRESDAGLIVGEADEAEYMDRMAALVARRTDLESKPSRPAKWVDQGTGKTYAEVWADPETNRQQVLIDAGVKLHIATTKPLVMEIELAPADASLGRGQTELHTTFDAMTRNDIAAMDLSGTEHMPKPVEGHTWHQPMEGVWVLTSDAIMAERERRELRREKIAEEFAYGPGDWDE